MDNPGDRKVIGNNMPRYLYGINLGASYGGFDLNIFLQGTGKRDAWIANTLNMPLYADFKFVPLYDDLSNYWKPADLAAGDYTCSNPNAEFHVFMEIMETKALTIVNRTNFCQMLLIYVLKM